MNLKKKIMSGVTTAVLGVALIAGGTFAYFSDTEVSNNTFAAGTLDLGVNPTTIIDVDNLKPGDTMFREFLLENNGSLDISSVELSTSYNVNDKNGDNDGEDLGEYIEVKFLKNVDKSGEGIIISDPNNVVYKTTLAELQNETPDAVENVRSYLSNLILGGEDSGLDEGTFDTMQVQFEFVDNDENQNHFQGDSLELEWTFTAHQAEGEAR